MSLTANEIILCNQSLDRIGSANITYVLQTTNEALKCITNYAQTRDSLLRSFEWDFASDRLKLVSAWMTNTAYTTDQYVWSDSLLYKCSVAHTSDVFVSNYLYWNGDLLYYEGDPVIDSGMVFDWTLVLDRPAFRYANKYALPADFLRLISPQRHYRWHHHFAIEGGYFLTDETSAKIEYIKQITDTTIFDSLFAEVLVLQLALKLLHPLTGLGTSSLHLKQELKQDLNAAMARARTVCRAETNQAGESRWNDARFTSGKFY